MSREATDLILGLAALEQAEYRAAHNKLPAAPSPAAGRISEGAVRKGSQAASSVPRWSAVDSDTGDLLDLLANEHPAIPSELDEWEHFREVLAKVATENAGVIDQNRTRPLLRGQVSPRRVGAYFHRAAKAGLIRAEGWTTSDDREGKNSGRPCRSYRYLGT